MAGSTEPNSLNDARSCNEDTQSDYVEFSNFNVELTDRKMRRMCGTKSSNVRHDVTSDGNFFRVTFKSNDAYDATGFTAFYQFRKYEGPSVRPSYVRRIMSMNVRRIMTRSHLVRRLRATRFPYLSAAQNEERIRQLYHYISPIS